jgi:DNA-directed RNA polymerase subunit RPC12/RpoP
MTRGRVSSLGPDVDATLKRRPRNFEGAFPLLLIGSVLLVYCAILRNEALASGGVHFPLWGVVGAVGVVIAGAGVYSVFLETDEPSVPSAPEGFVLVPKGEWEAARSHPRPSARSTSTTSVPPWWEGPPAYPDIAPEAPTSPTVPIETTQPYSVGAGKAASRPPIRLPSPSRPTGDSLGYPAVPRRPSSTVPAPGPVSPIPRRASTDELEETIAELEALVEDASRLSPRRAPGTRPGDSRLCADCGHRLRTDLSSNPCSGCGRELCVDCALSSQFEDADLRCTDCRARDLRAGASSTKTGAPRR